MRHFSCDICKRELVPGHSPRYVVKIEVFAAHNPDALREEDLDDDHMEEVSQLLHDVEDGLVEMPEVVPAYQHMHYDLCPRCRERFVRNPLNQEAAQKFDFSKN